MYQWEYLHQQSANKIYQQIAKTIVNNNAKNILDIGCGRSRWNEFMPNDYVYNMTGIDTDPEIISYCEEHYPNHSFILGDVVSPTITKQYDCIVFSGMLYYFRRLEEYVTSLVDITGATNVIVQEPRPSIMHKSPDFIPLFDRYAYEVHEYDIDIRMGPRHVYNLFTDTERPKRKIKATFNDNGDNIKQHDFDINLLRHGAYVTNTENIDSYRDGRITPANHNIDMYMGVCAGIKGLLKGALDYTPNKKFKYTWLDISPAAVDYKIWFDHCITRNHKINLDDIMTSYKKEVNDTIIFTWGTHKESLEDVLDDYLTEINLTREQWYAFLQAYAKCDKKYIKIDLINNVKLLNNLIEKDINTSFWFSNTFDWHQFRHSEITFTHWEQYLLSRNPGLECHGHRPPFTSM